VVRELQTGWTLRSGWMSCQDEAAFMVGQSPTIIEFLQPIADLNLLVKAIMVGDCPTIISDKQRGLLPAVSVVFSQAVHGFCQLHHLDNAAEPVAEADEQMKISLRQGVRAAVGGLIRQKQAEKPTVLTVTGVIPTPVVLSTPLPAPEPAEIAAWEREAIVVAQSATIVQDILQRVRCLLTLKGRPPFRLAGIERFTRLQEVETCVQ
jgi:hypothetical protein